MPYELILTIVNRGFADLVMDAAKKAGASGAIVKIGRAFPHSSKTTSCEVAEFGRISELAVVPFSPRPSPAPSFFCPFPLF